MYVYMYVCIYTYARDKKLFNVDDNHNSSFFSFLKDLVNIIYLLSMWSYDNEITYRSTNIYQFSFFNEV